MMKKLSFLLIFAGLVLTLNQVAAAQSWRQMDADELRAAVPEKAPVIREDIETELRTATGVTDGKKSTFGVVIITAGYEADGKYTHFFRVGRAMRIGELVFAEGDYIFGSQRIDAETLRVTFYRAKDGELVGAAKAKLQRTKGPIFSFLIEPPVGDEGRISIGRFILNYQFR